MWESHDRYPKRHQLNTFDALLHSIDFRLSLLPSDRYLAERARYTSGYTIRLWPESHGIHVLLDAPPDPVEPDPWDFEESITPEIELRSTLAVAQGLLGYELACPPPLRDLLAYVTADPVLATLHKSWESDLALTPPRPLHESLDSFAASLESYLTIDSIYARVDGPRPPRKRR